MCTLYIEMLTASFMVTLRGIIFFLLVCCVCFQIKQANFFGENWILSGSDCGRVFVWDKWTGDVVNMLLADSHVVNCIQPHPSAHMIATSGVDYDIKLWEPVDDKVCSLEDVTKASLQAILVIRCRTVVVVVVVDDYLCCSVVAMLLLLLLSIVPCYSPLDWLASNYH